MALAGKVAAWAALGALMAVACSTQDGNEPSSVGVLQQEQRAAPTVGPEFELSDVLKQAGGATPIAPRIACGPEECAVVWSTYMADRIVTGALRVQRGGTVLDQDPLLLTTDGSADVMVSAGSSGFVAVSQNRAFLFPTTAGGNGVTKLPAPIVGGEVLVALASNGDKHLLATTQASNDFTEPLTLRVVSQEDTSLPATAAQVTIGVADLVTATAGPDQFFVAHSDGGCERLSLTGTLLDATPVKYADRSRGDYRTHITPSAVYDGVNYLVAWTFGNTIMTARVGTDGKALDPDDTFNDISGSHAICDCYADYLNAWFDGRDVILTWYGAAFAADRKTFGARINRDTALLASAAAPDFTIDQSHVWLSYDAKGGLALLNGLTPLTVPATPGGPVLGKPKEYRFIAESQDSPAVASNGSGYLATWVNYDLDGKQRILATHVSAAGKVLDNPPLEIGPASKGARVSAAWGKTSYVVVWSNGGKVFARGVSDQGLAATTVAVPGATSQVETAVACNDEYCLAGFRQYGFNADCLLQGIRLDATTFATVEAQPFWISEFGADSSRGISIAADTTPPADMRTFLVAWVSDQGRNLVTRRIRSHLGAAQPAVYDTAGVFSGPTQPVVTTNGTEFVVIYTSAYNETIYNGGAMLFKVNALTGVVESKRWATPQYGLFPSVTYDGVDYVSTFFMYSQGAYQRRGARIDSTWTLVDASPFAVNADELVTDTGTRFTTPLFQGTPGAASDAAGHTLLAYPVADPRTLTIRLRAQLIANSTAEVDTGAGGQGGEAGMGDAGAGVVGNGGSVGGGSAGSASSVGGEPGAENAGAPSTTAGSVSGGTNSSGAPSGTSTGGVGSKPTSGDAGSTSSPAGSGSGCGCKQVGGAKGSQVAFLLFPIALALARRRRHKLHPRPTGHV